VVIGFQELLKKLISASSFRVRRSKALSLEECRELFRFMLRIGGCCALMSRSEAAACTRLLKALGLPSHHDPQKNWDTLKSLYYIVTATDVQSPVLDAGSGGRSTILAWLAAFGYHHLYACDIRPIPDRFYRSQRIKFSVQNLTRTDYPDRFFQAVTCISVIEHGVELHGFVREMSRILKMGGVLLISMDYWSEPIDCSGIYPYGKAMGEMKIFRPDQIQELISLAKGEGLSLCSPLELNTAERAVRWERMRREFTFAFVAMKKTSD